MAEHRCAVLGNRLVVEGDFSTDADTGFDAACQKLLAVADPELVVDLAGVKRMGSTYVGLLAELCLAASSRGRRVRVLAGRRIATTLRSAGLETAAKIEETR